MKKYLVLIFGIALGLMIGIFGVLIWENSSNKNTDNKTEVSGIATEESNTGVDNTGTSKIVVNEKVAEEIHDLFSNSYYRSQWLEFQKNGKRINEKSFKVFQVLSNGQALVYGKDEFGYYNGVVYLLIDKADSDMYDDQIIKVPKGKIVKRHGTYQYTTRSGRDKTVPKIMIMDAN